MLKPKKTSNRRLVDLTYDAIGTSIGRTVKGIRAVTCMIAGPGVREGTMPERGERPIYSSKNAQDFEKLMAKAMTSQEKPVTADLIFSEDGYKAFVSRAREAGLNVIELDLGDSASKRRDAMPAFQNGHEAVAKISQIIAEEGHLAPDRAESTIDRIIKSDFDTELKKALFEVIDADLIEARRRLEEEKDETDRKTGLIDRACEEREIRSRTLIQDNAEIAQALREIGFLRQPDQFLSNLEMSAQRIGSEQTLDNLTKRPALFGQPNRQPGFLETSEQATSRDNIAIINSGQAFQLLTRYAQNLKTVSELAVEAQQLQSKKDELLETVAQRQDAVANVETKLQRESALLVPETRKAVLRDSLDVLLKARENGSAGHRTEQPGTIRATGDKSLNARVEIAPAHINTQQILTAFGAIAGLAAGHLGSSALGPDRSQNERKDKSLPETHQGESVRRRRYAGPRNAEASHGR
ncbi:hypothetical protein [Microvirga tunisiensis]|uniref:Uncharacterized protein n=1 Tax=Microvirga tunisiensis TaxID=2108360 RepID=A0A5N7MAA6_9HYPH|nr:hypothetical protein [Microvirga tunisiensis]MPR05643.1 hypothetical protein [Microvirga tunisiensis]MPR23843.1 hypothetical protein [Microvirga tunisiensis]